MSSVSGSVMLDASMRRQTSRRRHPAVRVTGSIGVGPVENDEPALLFPERVPCGGEHVGGGLSGHEQAVEAQAAADANGDPAKERGHFRHESRRRDSAAREVFGKWYDPRTWFRYEHTITGQSVRLR